MPGTAAQPQMEVAGGFRLDIGPDEITVTADDSYLMRQGIATVGIACFALFMMVAARGWTFRLGIALLFGFVIWRVLEQKVRNLHATRTSLDVLEVVRGKLRNVRSFSPADVRNIRFTPIAYSRSGAILGLMFTASGKKMKILARLQAPEAQKILDALAHRGYEVEQNAGMQKMVEKELNRRNGKSFF